MNESDHPSATTTIRLVPLQVRLVTGVTPGWSGIMDHLIETFHNTTNITVVMSSSYDVWEKMDGGLADIAISHCKHNIHPACDRESGLRCTSVVRGGCHRIPFYMLVQYVAPGRQQPHLR